VKQEETRTHSQGSDHTGDWTADGLSTFPQLPIDICGFDVIGELEIHTRQKVKKSQGLAVLGILSNALENLLDNYAASSDILSLIKAHF
jgi:hypothetical protein